MSKDKRRLAITFLQNLPFKDFKESEHMKGTVKFWQESEKEKKIFSSSQNYKIVIRTFFFTVFFIIRYCR